MTLVQVAASYLHLYQEEILEICGASDMRLIMRKDGHLHLLFEPNDEVKYGYEAKLIKKYLEKQLNVSIEVINNFHGNS